jgi:hypothetical protein
MDPADAACRYNGKRGRSTMHEKESEINEAAYRRMEESIRIGYPNGHFVAIAGGEIVGDAGDFMTLHKALKAAGRDPRAVLIVQAGHVYPEKATIFAPGLFHARVDT